MYLNKVLLFGNLTRDPELRSLPAGGSVVSFGLATNRTYKDKSGAKQEATEFHNVVAFGKVAEIIGQYLKKGDSMYADGRLQTRSWDKEGVKQYRTEIVVENFQFGDQAKKEKKAPAPAPAPTESIEYPSEEINPEDIPF